MRCLWLFFILLISRSAFAIDSYADLVDQIIPSVVNISTEKNINDESTKVDNFMLNPDLNGRDSLGSGFFLRSDGYILTNYHVIKDAKTISVTTHDDHLYKAKIVGVDKPSDLVVLRVDSKKDEKFSPLIFGDAEIARVGDKILSFGNPYGLGISVSQGIISAKSRHIGLSEQQYIQTDAAINQGNSGGPLVDLDGKVIGINTAIFTTKGASGIGFALPSNIANWIATQIINHKTVKRGWIGITVSNGIDKYTGKPGFLITEIHENSNAYKDGLRVGDIITSYNDTTAENVGAFQLFTETMSPGQTLRLKVLSMGEEIKSIISVQEMPQSELKSVVNKALIDNNRYYYQEQNDDIFYISELNIAVKEYTPKGLLIVKLEQKSPLYGKGVKEGDVILEADREDIYSSDNLLDTIHNSAVDDRPMSLLIQSLDNTFYVNVEVLAEND